ncbi:MAG TPA: PadR family transcriptional regulator [Rubrivivax sp.]|nr:PadR family transcriptional regulator [Rubrivivax sp.]
MSLRHAILGFLDIEPATGYTLMQRFEGSVGSFWTATQSQIYRELHGLLEAGLVTMEVVPQDGRPPRKLHALTQAGRSELQRWLASPMEPMQLRDPLLLRLVFAAAMPAAQLDAALADYERGLRERLVEYRARMGDEAVLGLARSARERLIWSLSIDSGVAWCEAQLAWLRNARARLAAKPVRPRAAGAAARARPAARRAPK